MCAGRSLVVAWPRLERPSLAIQRSSCPALMTCRPGCCNHDCVALVPSWCATEEEARARELMGAATVLLVEDMDRPRKALCRYLGGELRLVEATNVSEGIARGRSALPELSVVMADLSLPDGSGWEVIAVLHAYDPTLRFLVISGIQDTDPPEDLPEELLEKVLFVDKPTSGSEIIAVAAFAYHLVEQDREARDRAAGRAAPPAPTAALSRPTIARRPDRNGLSRRESQAMRGCMLGLTNEEIAEQLGISFSTARKYVCAGLKKLRVASRHQVKAAMERGRRRGERK